MVLPAPMLALPSRAARNRRSGLSSHPPSRGDLLRAPLAGALSAGGSSPGTKLETTVRSGLETSRVFAASSRFQDNRCRQRGPHPRLLQAPLGPALRSPHWQPHLRVSPVAAPSAVEACPLTSPSSRGGARRCGCLHLNPASGVMISRVSVNESG